MANVNRSFPLGDYRGVSQEPPPADAAGAYGEGNHFLSDYVDQPREGASLGFAGLRAFGAFSSAHAAPMITHPIQEVGNANLSALEDLLSPVDAIAFSGNHPPLSAEDPAWRVAEQRPETYACVMKLNNWYLATHITPSGRHIFAKNLDARVMVYAIERFAQAQAIPHTRYLMLLSRPLVTVYQHNASWYPVALYATHKIRLVPTPGYKGSDNIEVAKGLAQRIAQRMGSSYHPGAMPLAYPR